jgi:L-iditol 2-dehydrogenase
MRADVLRHIVRIYVQTIVRCMRRRLRLPGAPGGLVSATHRGGGSLNLAPHFHVLATDLLPERLKLAREFSASRTFLPHGDDLADRVRRATRGQGLDAAEIAAPSDEAVRQAQALVGGGGQVLLFAHTHAGTPTGIDLSLVCAAEKDLIGSYSSDITLQEDVARVVFSRRLDVRRLITHRFALAATPAAIRLAANPTPQALKVVVSSMGGKNR